MMHSKGGQAVGIDRETVLMWFVEGGSSHIGLIGRDGKVLWELEIEDFDVLPRPWPVATDTHLSLVGNVHSSKELMGVVVNRSSGRVSTVYPIPIEAGTPMLGFGSSAYSGGLTAHQFELSNGRSTVTLVESGAHRWTRTLERVDQLRRLTLNHGSVILEGFDGVEVLSAEQGETTNAWRVMGPGCVGGDGLLLFRESPRDIAHWSIRTGTLTVLGPAPTGLPEGCAQRGNTLIIRVSSGVGGGQQLVAVDRVGRELWQWAPTGGRAPRSREQQSIDFVFSAMAPLVSPMPRYLPILVAHPSGPVSEGKAAPPDVGVLVILDLDSGQPVRVSSARTDSSKVLIWRVGFHYFVAWDTLTLLVIDGATGALSDVIAGSSIHVRNPALWAGYTATESGPAFHTAPGLLKSWKTSFGPGW